MKNLAIIIAVSDYNECDNLAGCVFDGEAIKLVIESSKKFDDILYISKPQDTISATCKKKLRDFVTLYNSEEINEVVFYFSGHGNYENDEFYYLLSDYNNNSQNTTALTNTEVDAQLKSLNTNLVVKIVDACNSGKSYIKDPKAVENYLNKSADGGAFNNCYFMFSSQKDQYSYQDANSLSDFTGEIIQAVKTFKNSEIAYKDILDHLADAFKNNTKQTPHFVTQGNFTEAFCEVSEHMITQIEKDFEVFITEDEKNSETSQPQISLVDIVREDAKQYCDQSIAIEKLQNFLNAFKGFFGNHNDAKDLKDLYNITFNEHEDYSKIENIKMIGVWLDSNKHNYFAKADWGKEYDSPFHQMASLATLATRGVDPGRTVIKGFKSEVPLTHKQIQIYASPKFDNLQFAALNLVPLISKTHILMFYSFVIYDDVNWEDIKPRNTIEWVSVEIELNDDDNQKEIADKIVCEFIKFILDPVKEKFWDS